MSSAAPIVPAAPGAVPATGRRRVCFAAILLLLLLGATLLLCEVGLRLLAGVLPEPLRSQVEESARTSVCNTRMYRGTRILLPPPPTDIAVVGDSFVFGAFVRGADAFPARLGRLTGRRCANFGICSQAPPTYNRMAEVAVGHRPALLLYCVFGNDFDTAAWGGDRELRQENAAITLPGDEALFLRGETVEDRLHLLRKRVTNLSWLFQFAKQATRRDAAPAGPPRVLREWNGRLFGFVPVQEGNAMVGFQTPAVRASVSTNAVLIQRVHDLTQAANTALLVVLIPTREMVYAPLVPDAHLFSSDTHRETYRALRAQLAQRKIACLDLTEPLQQAARSGEKLFLGFDGHFDEGGHAHTAKVLAEYLRLHPELLSR